MSVIPHIEEPPRTAGLGFSLARVKIRIDRSLARCEVELGSQFGECRTLPARCVPDGTLRASGVRVAVNQLASGGRPIRVVGIEEPETALHPAAAGGLMDALRVASTYTQVLVVTHSADLLEGFDLETDGLLLASMSGGGTRLSRMDTAGSLLRVDHFQPDPDDLLRQETASSAPHPNGESRPVARLRIAPIVEGHGEVPCIRIVLERLWYEQFRAGSVEILTPIRKSRTTLLTEDGLRKAVGIALETL